MQLCVRTQKGILKSSPIFGDTGNSKIPEELVELEKLGNEIQNQFIEASRSTGKGVKWIT